MKKFLVALSVGFALAFSTGGIVAAQTPTDAAKNQVCQGVGGQFGGTCAGASSGNQLERVVGALLNLLSVIAGVVAVVMIIVSGFKYITSGGDPNNISGAKRTLIYAIVGLIVVALAQVIVRFVLRTAA